MCDWLSWRVSKIRLTRPEWAFQALPTQLSSALQNFNQQLQWSTVLCSTSEWTFWSSDKACPTLMTVCTCVQTSARVDISCDFKSFLNHVYWAVSPTGNCMWMLIVSAGSPQVSHLAVRKSLRRSDWLLLPVYGPAREGSGLLLNYKFIQMTACSLLPHNYGEKNEKSQATKSISSFFLLISINYSHIIHKTMYHETAFSFSSN